MLICGSAAGLPPGTEMMQDNTQFPHLQLSQDRGNNTLLGPCAASQNDAQFQVRRERWVTLSDQLNTVSRLTLLPASLLVLIVHAMKSCYYCSAKCRIMHKGAVLLTG